MGIETEDFKNQTAQVLKEMDFERVNKTNQFTYENNDVLFVISLDKSNYSRTYYVRGSFFLKPLTKNAAEYKYYESMYRWYAKFPVYKDNVLFKKNIINTDTIDLDLINQKQFFENLQHLKKQLKDFIPSLNKEVVEKHHPMKS